MSDLEYASDTSDENYDVMVDMMDDTDDEGASDSGDADVDDDDGKSEDSSSMSDDDAEGARGMRSDAENATRARGSEGNIIRRGLRRFLRRMHGGSEDASPSADDGVVGAGASGVAALRASGPPGSRSDVGMDGVDPDDALREASLERLTAVLHSQLAWRGGSGGTPHTNLDSLIRNREALGSWSPAKRTRVSSTVLPQGAPEVMDLGNSRAYIGHFAEGGNVFVAGFQNQIIRLYEVGHACGLRPWRLRKEIVARALNWTITDTCMSPNQQLLVYSTISPILHVVNINATDSIRSLQNITDLHMPLDFGEGFSEGTFGLWTIKFSHDGKFLLAGSSDYATYLYDVEAQRVVSRAHAHRDDVNTVAFMDDASNVYLSGSDDTMIKVWDRRCAADGVGKAQGILQGHTEGLTHITAKGDGRYFISNAKDQKCKLWDIRAMASKKGQAKKTRVPKFYWDYRWQPYPGNPDKVKHPNDRSLMSFTGHRVLQTLIRCRWSPMETTGQRYIFSGSQCGGLFVYDILSGKKTAEFKFHRSVMRDCDWHPTQPMLASVGWDGSVVRWRNLPDDAPRRSSTDFGNASPTNMTEDMGW